MSEMLRNWAAIMFGDIRWLFGVLAILCGIGNGLIIVWLLARILSGGCP